MRIMVLVFFAALLLHPMAGQAQQDATSAGSILLGGGASFSSAGTDIEGDDDRMTTITFAPTFSYFISDGFGLGADIGIIYVSEGDHSITSMTILPSLLYTFSSEGSMRPYLGAGVGLWSMSNGDSESGLAFKVKAGFFNFFSDHYALFAEANFNYMKHEDFAMNNFGVALGFAGFIF